MKNITELNNEELVIVFNRNSKLQEMVFDDMMEDATFWNTEYLDCWQRGTIDYCIGYDRGAFFNCRDRNGFINGLKKAQEKFCFLADDWNTKIEYAEKLIYRLDCIYYNSTAENYDRLDTRIDELIKELETACYKQFMAAYEWCFNIENRLEYFINQYMETRIDDSYFVDEDYTLFEQVNYIKSYR